MYSLSLCFFSVSATRGRGQTCSANYTVHKHTLERTHRHRHTHGQTLRSHGSSACSWHRRGPTGRQHVPAWPDVPQKDRVCFYGRACVYVCVCVSLCVFKWMAGLSLKSWRPAASTSQMVPKTHIHKCTDPATWIQSARATSAAANPKAACWWEGERRRWAGGV